MKVRQILLLCFSAALCGCNAAQSDRPLFDMPQRSSALKFEDGLWVEVAPECKVDVKAPKKHWPKCAEWMVVSGNKVVSIHDSKSGDEAIDLFTVDGTPPIMQIAWDREENKKKWVFLAFVPENFSPARRLTALSYWSVLCGNEDPTDPSGVKVLPFPGFDEKCMTTSVEALRDAAARPITTDQPLIRWRWVRPEAP